MPLQTNLGYLEILKFGWPKKWLVYSARARLPFELSCPYVKSCGPADAVANLMN